MIDLLVSTRNAHKAQEIAAILGGRFRVQDLTTCHVPDVEETGTTFDENATLKAVAASLVSPLWVVADDSGLVVEALDGAPGVCSARYAGVGATDAANNSLLLRSLEGVAHRRARFCCVVVIAKNGRKLAAFEGRVEGTISTTPSGSGGFGYDPLFHPDGFDSSFAELPPSTKNRISHRAQALDQLSKWRGFF